MAAAPGRRTSWVVGSKERKLSEEEGQARQCRQTSIISMSLPELTSLTTCNCEMAVLPLELLFQLQPVYFQLQQPRDGSEGCLTLLNSAGGYNAFCDGSVKLEGHQYRICNYISRKVDLKTHMDYKDYRETILSRPMLFFINATSNKQGLSKEKTFAFIVNMQHPNMKRQIEQGMNNIISSVLGESYKLQFSFHKVVEEFLSKENYRIEEDTLSFSYQFTADALIDIFHLFGLSKNKVECHGKVMNLSCTNPEKKAIVNKFLTKMSTPLIRMLSASERTLSCGSHSSIDEE
ncbi:mesenteric estrogen-dependent adipogenesis protein [Microcaecilia unicolor]|uniref:Mesenteric estrogen-dependent adipogenesis protein n=1 Tax=Microcaecilia unicolor TaxID=1415580 RepID=A0A6P7XID9_9AMPH|nr:mesenteric estrogen-dependent adipogenesis protein [Microcaecilia unicolor]